MGGTGNDVLDGGTGIDTAVFSDKTTAVVLTLHGATSAIVTVDGVAEDTVRNIENVTGGSGGDTLRGDSLANTLSGGIGNDTLRGGGGGDTLNGGNDADVFEYTATNDAIAGESVNGGSGTDTLRFLHTGTLDFQSVTVTSIERIAFANSGVFSSVDLAATQFGAGISNAVEITGNALQNAIDINMAAAGTFSAAGWTFVNWGVGNDILNFFGSDGADTITGSSQADQIRGGDGADTINAGDGGDIIIVQSDDIVAGETLNGGGGVGFDIVNLATSNAVTSLSPAMLIDIEGLGLNNRVNVTAIVTGSQIGVGAITTVSSTPGDRVQALIVNADNNADLSLVTFTGWDSPGKTITINGSSVSNILTGSSQIDALNGGGDADILNGGLGSDTLSGGTGKDAFFFTTTLNAATNVDTITDFSVAEVDTVLLDHTIFNTLAGSVGGTITSQEFRIGGAAQDADDRIIYNDATGALFFDPDGNGGTVAVQFATLSPGLALTNGLIGII
jgi:Ca2+-binding RTX toxin-like protein